MNYVENDFLQEIIRPYNTTFLPNMLNCEVSITFNYFLKEKSYYATYN